MPRKKKSPSKAARHEECLSDRPEQAVESGEPKETGRTRGEVLHAGAKKTPDTRNSPDPKISRHPESGRHEAKPS